jgi:ferredoxin
MSGGQRAHSDFVVPPSLRGTPGTEKDRKEEAFFNRIAPEPEWLTNSRPGKAMERLEMAFTSERPEIKRVWGQRIAEQAQEIRDAEHAEPSACEPTADITSLVKDEAMRLGFDAVGIARFHRTYVYSNYLDQVRYKHLIVLALERPPDDFDNEILSVAYMHKTQEVMHQGTEWMLALIAVLRARGYRGQVVAGPIGINMVKVLPYAEEAGLGQMGLNGQLLSPYFGSRWHPFALSTDAPLTPDGPRDFGIPKLCDSCQVCVRRCPGRAIPKVRVHWRGAYKNKLDVEKCVPMLMRYATCNVCTKVCPVQKYGLAAVAEHYEATGGEVLGKGTDELEGYTLPDRGYQAVGVLPGFTKDESRIRYELLDELPADIEPWVHQVGEAETTD